MDELDCVCLWSANATVHGLATAARGLPSGHKKTLRRKIVSKGSLVWSSKQQSERSLERGWEWERARLSFPMTDIRRSIPSGLGCQFPDAILHGKRSCAAS